MLERKSCLNSSRWRSSSLYVGDLGKDVTEVDLMNTFSRLGLLESVKVCTNWNTGESLGYGFLNFFSVDDAEKVLQTSNFCEIKGKPCRLMWSNKRSLLKNSEDQSTNLYVKGLAKCIDNKLFLEMFKVFGEVLSCRIATEEMGISLGYGYISLASKIDAMKAIRYLNGRKYFGSILKVEEFVAKSKRKERKWTNVFVTGLPLTWTKIELQKRFQVFGEISSTLVMKNKLGQSRGFGFVDFKEHESALVAIQSSLQVFVGTDSDIFSIPLEISRALNKSENEARKNGNQSFMKTGTDSLSGRTSESSVTFLESKSSNVGFFERFSSFDSHFSELSDEIATDLRSIDIDAILSIDDLIKDIDSTPKLNYFPY